MKKISEKDFILLFVIAGAIFLYLMFSYFYEPYEKKLIDAKAEKENLEVQMSADYLDSLQGELGKLKNDLIIVKEEKKQSDSVKTLTKKEQENILLNIGEKATSLNINLVKFEEKTHIKSFEYSIIPYNIKARGENSDLIILMNSLYEKYNYFHIDEVNMRKLKVVSEFERPSGEINIEDSTKDVWSEEFLDLVKMDFPAHLLTNDRTTSKDEKPTETSANNSTKKLNSELQLDFTIYFITKNE